MNQAPTYHPRTNHSVSYYSAVLLALHDAVLVAILFN